MHRVGIPMADKKNFPKDDEKKAPPKGKDDKQAAAPKGKDGGKYIDLEPTIDYRNDMNGAVRGKISEWFQRRIEGRG